MTAKRDLPPDPGPMRFRKMETQLSQALAVRQRADERVARISAEMRRAREAEVARLGLTPEQAARLTPVILDTLDRIEVDGDCWIWHGARNNKGLPRMRDTQAPHPYPERSACVLLDRMLNGSDGTGMRFPACRSGKDCVNPAHKRTRGAGIQMHGPGDFTPKAEAS